MSRLWKFLKITVVSHTVLAAGVFVHSRLTGRDAGRWLPLTFVFGLIGFCGYLRSDR